MYKRACSAGDMYCYHSVIRRAQSFGDPSSQNLLVYVLVPDLVRKLALQ